MLSASRTTNADLISLCKPGRNCYSLSAKVVIQRPYSPDWLPKSDVGITYFDSPSRQIRWIMDYDQSLILTKTYNTFTWCNTAQGQMKKCMLEDCVASSIILLWKETDSHFDPALIDVVKCMNALILLTFTSQPAVIGFISNFIKTPCQWGA